MGERDANIIVFPGVRIERQRDKPILVECPACGDRFYIRSARENCPDCAEPVERSGNCVPPDGDAA